MCALFSPEIVQAGAMKGLSENWVFVWEVEEAAARTADRNNACNQR